MITSKDEVLRAVCIKISEFCDFFSNLKGLQPNWVASLLKINDGQLTNFFVIAVALGRRVTCLAFTEQLLFTLIMYFLYLRTKSAIQTLLAERNTFW